MPDRREDLVRKMIAEGTDDDDIRATLKVFDAQVASAAPAAQPGRTWGDTALDVGKGIVKGAASSVASLGELAVKGGMIPGQIPGGPRHPVFTRAEEMTTATNTPQLVGKGLETAAEFLLPVSAVSKAIPRTARAAGRLQGVMMKAKDAPVNVEAPGQVALRIQQLAERGGTMPRMVGRLLQRTTDPTKGPMAFDEGRDFYSNVSRLSADEYGRLTGPIKREVGNLRSELHKALTDAADTVGMGDDYAKGISEYARAAKLKDKLGDIGDSAKKALPLGLGAGAVGAGGYAAKKLMDLLMGKE